jgi:hypothetical protein
MADRVLVPDVIIGGAPRSGTTFLIQALDRHPEVYVAKPIVPEPKVFFGPVLDADGYHRRYAQLFGGADAAQVLVEKTTNYFESSRACALIRQHLPRVRLLFMLREPVARAYSNYLWSKKNGLETLPFEEAVALEGRRQSPLPPEKAHARPYDYLIRGDYATFAQAYLDAFGRENVGFFLYEDIERHPEKLLADIQQFLGVSPLPFERLNVGVVNSARELGPDLDPRLHALLKERMAPAVYRLAALTGMDLSAWGYGTARRQAA